MSYAAGAALQAAVYTRLTTAAALAGVAIHDAVPVGEGPETWVLIGAEEVRDAGDTSGPGAEHRMQISVISRADGFLPAKTIAGAICDAMDSAPLTLSRGAVAGCWFHQARASRSGGGRVRRIDLTFRVRLDPGHA